MKHFILIASSVFFMTFSSCNNQTDSKQQSTETITNADETIIKNKDKHEVVLLKGKEFTEEQKKYLRSVGYAADSDLLHNGDTIEVMDTVSRIKTQVIIKGKFGTY